MAMDPQQIEPTAGESRIEPWDSDGAARIVAAADEPRAAIDAGIRAVLALATGRDDEASPDAVAIAAPIQGQGGDLAALFAALADDLLDQLAAMGGGFGRVRLDGLLRTDDGGWTAWGYLLGQADGGATVPIARRGSVAWERDDRGHVTLRCAFERRS